MKKIYIVKALESLVLLSWQFQRQPNRDFFDDMVETKYNLPKFFSIHNMYAYSHP